MRPWSELSGAWMQEPAAQLSQLLSTLSQGVKVGSIAASSKLLRRRQKLSFAQRNPVPLGRLSIVPQSRSLVRKLTAGLSQDPPRIALIAPRSGPLGSLRGADR